MRSIQNCMSFGATPNSCLEHAPSPQRGGLLVFGNADAPPLQVAGTIDPGILSHQDLGMKKFPGRENRQTDPAVRRPSILP